MSEHDSIDVESTFPALEKPELKSDIPPHLVKEVGESERYVLEQLSILSQYATWSIKAEMDTNAAVRRTNGRLMKVEKWKSMMESWWVLAGAVLSIIGGLSALVAVTEFAIKLLHK